MTRVKCQHQLEEILDAIAKVLMEDYNLKGAFAEAFVEVEGDVFVGYNSKLLQMLIRPLALNADRKPQITSVAKLLSLPGTQHRLVARITALLVTDEAPKRQLIQTCWFYDHVVISNQEYLGIYQNSKDNGINSLVDSLESSGCLRSMKEDLPNLLTPFAEEDKEMWNKMLWISTILAQYKFALNIQRLLAGQRE